MSQEVQTPGAGQKPSAAIVITREEVEKRPPAGAGPTYPPVPGAAAPPTPKAPEVAQARPLGPPAGFWVRLAAKIIDHLVVLLAFGLAFGLVLLEHLSPSSDMPLGIFWDSLRFRWPQVVLYQVLPWYLLVYAFYSIFSHAAWGRSIGKTICGIRVALPDESRHRVTHFLGRFLAAGFALLLLGLGHIMAGFRADKRALHDLAVGSRVVKGE
jgi:uncharacterized RDD family membrane protein YckC